MSSFIWDLIREGNLDAEEYLTEVDTNPLSTTRAPGTSDADFERQLQSCSREASVRDKELQRLVDSLSVNISNLTSTRTALTGKERTEEETDFKAFTSAVPYSTTIRRLNAALRNNTRILSELNNIHYIVQRQVGPPAPVAEPCSVSLPTLQLPVFHGQPTEWLSFWDRFRYAVHDVDVKRLPPVIKFSHLLNCLKGPALDVVSGLPVCDSSYAIAVKLLSDQYGNSETNIKLLYNQLEALKCNGKDTPSLQKFSNELERVLLQLSYLGEDITSYSLYLSIAKKLPYYLQKEVIREEKNTPTKSRLQMIRDKIRDTIREREEVDVLSSRFTTPSKPTYSSPPASTPKFTGPAFSSFRRPQSGESRPSSLTFVTATTRPNLPCVFCASTSYHSPECDKFSTFDSRIATLKRNNRCTKCASSNHSSKDCQRSLHCTNCRVDGHLSLLCFRRFKSKEGGTKAISFPAPQSSSRFVSNSQQSSVTVDATTNVNNVIAKRTVLLKCVKVDVINPSNPSLRATALAMFDDGSTTSYISYALAGKLKLTRIHSNVLSYGVFGDPSTQDVLSDVVSLSILGQDESIAMSAQTVKFLSCPVPHAIVTKDEEQALRDSFSPVIVQHGSPDILIGMDFYNEFVVRHRANTTSGFSLFDSKVGPILGGSSTSLRSGPVTTNTVVTLSTSQAIEDQISNFFDVESVGIDDSLTKTNSLDTFKDSVHFNGQRYEVRFPWNHFPPALPSNYGLSLGRFRSTIRSLRKSPDLLQKYDDIIKDQLKREIIEEAPNQHQQPIDRPVHYLPHQPVVREDKGKVRIVYDASAKASQSLKSLNDCLDPGPVLLKSLVGVLLRFRLPAIVVACDIEKAFLQIEINPNDRDVTRFFWLRDVNSDESSSNLAVFRFRRVPFGLTCSPFLLAATLISHFQQDNSPLGQEILNNLYVDNILFTGNSTEQLQQKCDIARTKFAQIGMNLREFVSNDPAAVGHIAEADRLQGDEQKLLGSKWNLSSDSLWFRLPLPVDRITSKRLVLSAIASNFDPLGLCSPAVVSAKLFFQRLWQQTTGWDDSLTDDLSSEWQQILESWRSPEINVSRKSTIRSASKLSLHVFCDASQYAYACCVYLVSENEEERESHLIFAKSKIRPTRLKENFSIHRMELLGAVIATRAIIFVHEELSKSPDGPLLDVTLNLWTDSSTVLHWLRSSARQEPFVQNRINLIRQTKNLVCRYVVSEENPADIASRGCSSTDLINNQLWWHGPCWLISSTWPTTDIPVFESNQPLNQPASEVTFQVLQIESIVDFARFSSYGKLVNSVAYAFRFLRRLGRLPQQFHSSDQFPSTILSVDERRKSEIFILLEAQRLSSPSEVERAHLKLYEDEHKLLRSRGCIEKSGLSRHTHDPIYLPRRSHITHLIIAQEHRLNLHSGSLLTLSQLRRRYWIPQGRRTVTSAIRRLCMSCRRYNAQPFRVPEFPQLPAERVNRAVPFEFTGVDYFGSLNVKVNKRIQKVWVALFTCLTVRAVYLEVVSDMSTASYLLAFKRFTARRGLPRKIWSDNGTQLTLAAKTLDARLQLDFEEKKPAISFEHYLSEHGVRWEFITEHAPWKGGFYERLIGLTKEHLRRTLQRELLQVDAFATLITEIESVLNLRPITFTSDRRENPSPLRPIDFLSVHDQFRYLEPHPFVPVRLTPFPSSQKELLYLWEEQTQRVDSFWKEWVRDYLLALRERQRLRLPGIAREPIPGEVVFLFDGSLSRSKWKTAVVVSLEPREDGAVRTASVRLATGNVVKRPILHLFPLETTYEM